MIFVYFRNGKQDVGKKFSTERLPKILYFLEININLGKMENIKQESNIVNPTI